MLLITDYVREGLSMARDMESFIKTYQIKGNGTLVAFSERPSEPVGRAPFSWSPTASESIDLFPDVTERVTKTIS